jgi:hypothetical protein
MSWRPAARESLEAANALPMGVDFLEAQVVELRALSTGCARGRAISRASARTTEMSEVTYYVALPFVAADDGIAPEKPWSASTPNAAVMRAEALSRKLGTSARSPSAGPATGDFGDAKLIRKFGNVPDLSAL